MEEFPDRIAHCCSDDVVVRFRRYKFCGTHLTKCFGFENKDKRPHNHLFDLAKGKFNITRSGKFRASSKSDKSKCVDETYVLFHDDILVSYKKTFEISDKVII